VYKFLGIMAGFRLACLPAAAQTQQPIRINCGGPANTDTNGQVWQADTGYNTGTAFTINTTTAGTTDPTLYLSYRYNDTATTLIYSLPVANGSYRVNLLFSETAPAAQAVGARVFNVKVNSLLVLQDFDISGAVGANAAVVESFNTTVTTGAMAIEFDKVLGNPKINAIEILPLANSPLLTLNFTYTDGTPVTGTLNYAMATSLLTIGGQLPLANGKATCVLVTSPAVLGLVGQTNLALNLVDGTGNMVWQISMGVNPADANLTSVENSTLNVVLTKP
jgi:hypothetical protein